jgi:hypothetical protein
MSSSARLLFNNRQARTTAIASKEYVEVATSMEVAAAGVNLIFPRNGCQNGNQYGNSNHFLSNQFTF